MSFPPSGDALRRFPCAKSPDDLKGVQAAADASVGPDLTDNSPTRGSLAQCEFEFDSSSIAHDVITLDQDPSIPGDTVVLRYRGPIVRATIGILTEAWSGAGSDFETFILDLDSQGGDLDSIERVIDLLAEIRTTLRLVTLVRQGSHCLSGCLPVFMEGEERIAGNASTWMIHGACRGYTNVPSLALTDRYLKLMEKGGVGPMFLHELVEGGFVLKPGQYWLSGRELHEREDANVITRLLGPWMPEGARPP